MAKGFSVFVSVGANILPSVAGAASKVEKTFATMNRRLRVQAAETKVAYREMASAMKPLVALGAAGGLSIGLKGVLGDGASFMHEVAALRIAGRTANEVAQAIKQANRTVQDVPTSTLTSNLSILRETVGAYGDMSHAMKNLSFNTRLGYMMTNIMGMDRETAQHSLVAGIQALEIRGSAMDSGRYQREMNSLFQASSFFAGKEGAFTPQSLREFAKTGNLPLKMFGERFMTRILPAMITEVGSGDIVGTQATAFNNWVMGRVGTGNKNAVAYATRIGLVPQKGMGGNLSATGWTPGSMSGTNLALNDPLQWAESILLPKLAKAGVNINDTKALSIAMSQLMTKETARRYAMTLSDPLQRARLHRDEGNINRAMSSEAGYKFMLGNDPTAAWAKLMAKMDNLGTTLGEKVFTPNVIAAIGKIADGINALAGAFDRHPNWAKGVVGLMGLGAAGATLSLFGIKLKWVAGIFWGFGRWVVGRLPTIGNMVVSFFRTGLGRAIFSGVRFLAAGLGRALLFLIPAVLEGLGAIVAAVVGAPVWVTVAVIAAVAAAGAFIWHFRTKIWNGLKSAGTWFMSFPWGSIGASIAMAVANGLSFGLASRIPAIAGSVGGWWSSHAPTWLGGASAPAVPKLAGQRAFGGPVNSGRTYLVGERGPELFTAGRTGTIIPHSETKKALSGGRGGDINATFHITGATDPAETGRQVERHLKNLARRNEFALSD